MGTTFSSPEQPAPNAWPKDKNSYYMVPESPFDQLEERADLPFECPRFTTSDVSHAATLPVEDPVRQKLTKDLIRALHQYQFVVLECSAEENQVQQQVVDMMKEFFDRPVAEKEAAQGTEESFGSGWKELVFENRDSVRDKEIREVYQVRLGAEGNTPWPDDHFKELSYTHYRQQWDLCLHLAHLLLSETEGFTWSDFMRWVTGVREHLGADFAQSAAVEDFHENTETNLSMFRYTDTQGYTCTQKCMVHQDNGLVTLLPKSTLPGLQILYDDQWIPLEEHTKPGDMLLYVGLATQLISHGTLPALRHRVIRQPATIRYSLPFELKPNKDAQITEDSTADQLWKGVAWERVMNSVRRADSARDALACGS